MKAVWFHLTGCRDIIEALATGGLFRLRGVLPGTVAFQTYAAILSVRLPGPAQAAATSSRNKAGYNVAFLIRHAIKAVLQ